MPSVSALKYSIALNKALNLRKAGLAYPPKGSNRELTATCFHAALATYVGGWEVYIEDLVREYYSICAQPLNLKFSAMHAIALEHSNFRVAKFNTPNWENGRNLLSICTGYDPIGDWIWPVRRMSAVHVRDRLTEVLKVRHSFAHTHQIPSYSWTASPSGNVRITKEALLMVEAFFKQLIKMTDKGMHKHIKSITGINSW